MLLFKSIPVLLLLASPLAGMIHDASEFSLFSATEEKSGIAEMQGTTDYRLALDSTANPQADNTVGTVTFAADSAIINLEKGKRGFKDIKGYRVQIFIGPADQLKPERNKFLMLGLDYSVYQKSIIPEYVLQVGDFPTKMEMEKHLEIIRKHYPKAFPVVEVIEAPRFGK